MRGIDWDKARRNRNVWKRNYRENFREGRPPERLELSPSRNPSSLEPPPSTSRYIFARGPKPAKEIKMRLSALGLRGSALTKATNQVLTRKQELSVIEAELWVKRLFEEGFEPVPMKSFEVFGDTAIMRLVKCGKNGDIEKEATITFRKQSVASSSVT